MSVKINKLWDGEDYFNSISNVKALEMARESVSENSTQAAALSWGSSNAGLVKGSLHFNFQVLYRIFCIIYPNLSCCFLPVWFGFWLFFFSFVVLVFWFLGGFFGFFVGRMMEEGGKSQFARKQIMAFTFSIFSYRIQLIKGLNGAFMHLKYTYACMYMSAGVYMCIYTHTYLHVCMWECAHSDID